MDDESSDTLMQDELADRRIDKLNSRVTWVALLVPILVVLVIVLVYLDLSKRVLNIHDTGSTEVQVLSENLQDRFSSLSVKQAKLEEITSQMTASVKQVTEKVEKDLKTLETRIQQTSEKLGQTKSDRDALKNAFADINKALDPIRKDLKIVTTKLGTLNKRINKELTHLNGSLADFSDSMTELSKRIDQEKDHRKKLQKEITDLSLKKIDQQDIASALDEEKKIYREMMRLIAKNFGGRLDDIQREIEVLKKKGEIFPDPTAIQDRTDPLPESPPENPQPGEIVEKSLQ